MSLFFMQMILYYIHNQHRQLNLLSDNFYRVVDIPAPEQFPYTMPLLIKTTVFFKNMTAFKKKMTAFKKNAVV